MASTRVSGATDARSGRILPAPEVIAREIVGDLTAALVEFEAMAAALVQTAGSTQTLGQA
jgi:hypothetical protein